MTGQLWTLVGTVLVASFGLAGSWLLYRQQGRQVKTTDAQQIIDQLQENRKDDDARHAREIAEVRGRVENLEAGQRRMESRELAFFDYVAALRWHIDQGKGPPPPPWPAALMNRD